jgi:hypothetical protein
MTGEGKFTAMDLQLLRIVRFAILFGMNTEYQQSSLLYGIRYIQKISEQGNLLTPWKKMESNILSLRP